MGFALSLAIRMRIARTLLRIKMMLARAVSHPLSHQLVYTERRFFPPRVFFCFFFFFLRLAAS